MNIEQISQSVTKGNRMMALPPEHQIAREKEAILKDPRLYELIGEEKVLEIRKNLNVYTVVTEQGKEIPVRVVYVPAVPERVGPLQFKLVFGEEAVPPQRLASSRALLRKMRSEEQFLENSVRLLEIK
jgi:hypothetical protein